MAIKNFYTDLKGISSALRLDDALVIDKNGIRAVITKSSHGFIVGDVLRHNGTNWVKAQADADGTLSEPPKVVFEVIDVNTFGLGLAGVHTWTAHGLTPGSKYYLSAATAGLLTTTAPARVNHILTPIDANTVEVMSGQSSALAVKDEGSLQGGATIFDFVGAGVSAAVSGGTATITIAGGGGNTFADNVFRVQDSGDTSKQLAFEVSGVTASTTRTLTVQNVDGTIATTANTDIIGLTTDGSPDAANDYVRTYDASATSEKKVLISALQSALASWATSALATDAVTLVNRTAFYRTLSGNSTLSFSGVAAGGEYRFYFTASGANRDVIIPSGHYTPGGQKTFTIESGNTLPMELFYVNSIYMWTIGTQIKA